MNNQCEWLYMNEIKSKVAGMIVLKINRKGGELFIFTDCFEISSADEPKMNNKWVIKTTL